MAMLRGDEAGTLNRASFRRIRARPVSRRAGVAQASAAPARGVAPSSVIGSPGFQFRPQLRDEEQNVAGIDAGRRADDFFDRFGEIDQNVTDTRGRFRDALGADPLDEAQRVQSFLAQSAQGFSDQLMPGLQQGLRATRSRFSGGGGAIRSGAAQTGEENAFRRLFANPLQSRIAQLATASLDFGQREVQRDVGNEGDLLGFDFGRSNQALGAGERAEGRQMGVLSERANRAEGGRRFDLSLEEERRQFEAEQKARRRRGIGGLLGTLAGGTAGFFLGGPPGAMAGAQIGGRAGGGG